MTPFDAPFVLGGRRGRKTAWSRRARVTSIALFVCTAFLCLWHMQRRIGISAERQICESNLRNLGSAWRSYTSDYGVHPATLDVLIGEQLSDRSLICPFGEHEPPSLSGTGTTRPAVSYSSYRLVPNVPPSDAAVVAYDLAPHGDGRTAFLLAEGTVLWLDAQKAQRWIASLEGGINPPVGQPCAR
jgi:hypothetical protein